MLYGFIAVQALNDLVPVRLYLGIRNRAVYQYIHIAQTQVVFQEHEGNRLCFLRRINVDLTGKMLIKLTRRGHGYTDFDALAGKLVNLKQTVNRPRQVFLFGAFIFAP
jgi:hypothetical protein